MSLITVKQLAEDYGLLSDRVYKLLHQTPVARQGRNRTLYYSEKVARKVIQRYVDSKSCCPDGTATFTGLIEIHKLSVQTLKHMRRHPDMPKPVGRWRNKSGVFCDYYVINDVLAFAKSRQWLNITKPGIEEDDDDDEHAPAYAIPSASVINPLAKAFVSWDFKSPLRPA